MAIRSGSHPTTHEAGTPVTAAAYARIALADPIRTWELHLGRLREKPGMSVSHNRVTMRLGKQLLMQLDEGSYEVRIDMSRVGHGGETYYVPDVFVVPTASVATIPDRPGVLEVFTGPLPLVVEVWSPSTGAYEVGEKLRAYQRRGDEEIWRLHPYERTLTAWRRQPDGSYAEATFAGGIVRPIALPNVAIDLDALFAA